MGGFELLDRIGEGGSGVVYRVRDTAGAERALKVLKPDLLLSDRERSRFRDEAERMQRVAHDSVVTLTGIGELPDGSPWISMPLLEGETLAKRLSRGPLDVDAAVRIAGEIGRGLEAIHAAGMLHRDIKPENVFLTLPNSRAVILDFGIAREIDGPATTTTRDGRMRGTPAYMAPERFFGAPATIASEVYELGVTLYLMLVGELPWSEERAFDERLNPLSPRERGVAVPGHVNNLLMRALSTRPEARPPSVGAFVTGLDAPLQTSFEARETEDVSVDLLPVRDAGAPRLFAQTTVSEARVVSESAQGETLRGTAVHGKSPGEANGSPPLGARNSVRSFALFAVALFGLTALGLLGARRDVNPLLEARSGCLEPTCFPPLGEAGPLEVPARSEVTPPSIPSVEPTVRAATDARAPKASPRATPTSGPTARTATTSSERPEEGDAKFLKDRR